MKKNSIVILISLFLTNLAFTQVVINEYCASNLNGILDEDYEVSDWIELYNNSDKLINLEGYHLSDDWNNKAKWTFPELHLNPYSHLLIYASGKDRQVLSTKYQTIIFPGDSWQYIVPSTEIGDAWKGPGFDASSWETGSSGFGYGDNDDATILPNILSIYIRKEFTITNLQDIQEMILSIDYDDGYVAYINGKEISRSNLGDSGSHVAYNQTTGIYEREATMYQPGGFPENFYIYDPQNYLVEGLNILAIQGHNSKASSTDFSLIPMLSLGMVGTEYLNSIPEYIQIKRNELHTNFKLDADGESVLFLYPGGTIADTIPARPLQSDISHGRKPDGSSFWYFFATPTPGTSNISKGYSNSCPDSIKFSVPGGYYPGSASVALSTNNSLDSVFYTIDGTDPDNTSILYKSPVSITGDVVIKARVIRYDNLPGRIFANTYYSKQHHLPVICISTDPENLWDYYSGIYVKGPNASSSYPYKGANFWQDWEKKAHMEYYDIEGAKRVDQGIGIKIYGAYSRAHPQKSLALFARKEYGKGSFQYPFFKDKPINEFEALVLRNSGNDWNQAFIRDALTTSLIKDMNIDRLALQPVILYLNGEYWGILNLREKINSHYLAENHFVDPENVNLLEDNSVPLDGSNISYLSLISYLNTHTLVNEQYYQHVIDKIDIENYIQYEIAQIYAHNKDWPGNNIKFWNLNETGSKWRWIIFDTDVGWGLRDTYAFNSLEFSLQPNSSDDNNPPWSTLLLRRLMTNPGFKKDFINQFADRINTTFIPERVNFILDSLRNIYQPEIQAHISRWELNYNDWQNSHSLIEKFVNGRPPYARNFLDKELGYPGKMNIMIEIDPPSSGRVKINSVIPETYPFYGTYYKNLPVTLFALPAEGHKFVRWEGSVSSDNIGIDHNMNTQGKFKAIFEPCGEDDYNIVINEINYNSSLGKNSEDWIELFNAGRSTINLKNWFIIDDGYDYGFKFPDDQILLPGMYIVICRDIEAFRKVYYNIQPIAGNLNFGLSSSGDEVRLYSPKGKLVDHMHYNPLNPWPEDANGNGATLELIDPSLDNDLAENWAAGQNGGTPGRKNNASQVTSTEFARSSLSNELSCYPNPFTDYTSIRIEIRTPGNYRLEVYDLQGRLINTLVNQVIETGAYYMEWNGTCAEGTIQSPGIYIIKLSGKSPETRLKVIKLD